MNNLPKKLLGFGAFIGEGRVIRVMKYADAMAKVDTLLQGMIDRRKKIGRWYGLKMWTKIT